MPHQPTRRLRPLLTRATLAALVAGAVATPAAYAAPAAPLPGAGSFAEPASVGGVGSAFGVGTASVAGPLPAPRFDLQAHRGGLGLNTESSPYSFGAALAMGVSTLELDTQVTADDAVVVSHDRKVNPGVCRDTAPAVAGDALFPYVGHLVHELTLAQLRTLDCGSVRKKGFDVQQTHPGSRMMELREVFDLVRNRRAFDVHLNIETKVEAGSPVETAPRAHFVDRVHAEIAASGLARQVTVQSFDWGALRAMHALDATVPLVALTNDEFLQRGRPGASPWLGGLDVDDFGGDGVAAAASLPGVTTYSPVATLPQDCSVVDDGCVRHTTRQMIDDAHRRGLRVVPWTVDDRPTMIALLDDGVDGIISDYPDRLRAVLAERWMPLPRAHA